MLQSGQEATASGGQLEHYKHLFLTGAVVATAINTSQLREVMVKKTSQLRSGSHLILPIEGAALAATVIPRLVAKSPS